MSHLLTLAIVNPGQGKAPPGAAKLTTILQWTAWGVFALCVGGVLISVPGTHPGQQHQAPAAAAPSASTPARSTASGTGCDLPAGSQLVPSSSPPSAQWGTVGSMQVPQSPAEFGPERQAGVWDT